MLRFFSHYGLFDKFLYFCCILWASWWLLPQVSWFSRNTTVIIYLWAGVLGDNSRVVDVPSGVQGDECSCGNFFSLYWYFGFILFVFKSGKIDRELPAAKNQPNRLCNSSNSIHSEFHHALVSLKPAMVLLFENYQNIRPNGSQIKYTKGPKSEKFNSDWGP